MLDPGDVRKVMSAAGPDVVQQWLAHGYTFAQTIERLAAHYGVSLRVHDHEREDPDEERGQRRLLSLVDHAAEFYSHYLWNSTSDIATVARQYLANRGIEPATAAAFRLGAAPASNELSTLFMQQGVPTAHLMLGGLGYDGGGDVFKQRLMLPVRRPDGKVHGFGGRVMVQGDTTAKYINSPTTLLFDKGHALYTPPGLRLACARAGYVVLVEGYLDVVAMWQAGFTNVCSIMGIAATKGQITRLAKLAPTVVVSLDPDVAGERASVTAALGLQGLGMDVRMAALRGGDPDELLRAEWGPDYVRQAISQAAPFEWGVPEE